MVEFRLCGPPRGAAKTLIYGLYKRFGVRGNVTHRPVPHVTLYGPFQTQSIRQVMRIISGTAQNYGPFCYTITRFGSFDKKIGQFSKKNVVYMKINPGPDMKQFRTRLYNGLSTITEPKDPSIDKIGSFTFHVTLALKDIDRHFHLIWKSLIRTRINVAGEFCGVTLLQNGKIMCEYDLGRGRMLSRAQALRRRCTSR